MRSGVELLNRERERQRCTDRGNEPSVPLQHHVNVLHHTQQVEEATAGEERGEAQLHGTNLLKIISITASSNRQILEPPSHPEVSI